MKRLLPLVLVLVFCSGASAQGVGTGFPPYGSIESGIADATNRQNLNTNFSIPIISTKGRGLDLNFSLAYNSLLWKISSGAWVSVTDSSGNPTWGWMKLYPTGMVTDTSSFAGSCKPDGIHLASYYRYSNYFYYDTSGTAHAFPTISWYYQPCTDQTVGTTAGSATDGSGYYFDSQSNIVRDKSGLQISPASQIKDTNGNYVSGTVNGSETDWKDSAGHLALKVISNAGNIQYEVLDPTGAYQITTLTLTTYNIKTNFGCSGVTEYTGTASLPSSISLPTGLSYSITYEGTPGNSGYYTGRVSKLTLPNGGYIQYQYNSPNDGISCNDASILNLTRTQNDGTTSSAWTFNRAPSGSNWVTTITAPQMPYDSAANQSVYTFNSMGQETSRQVYQGSSTSGTLLRTVNTTWAANGSPATKITILDDNHQSEIETTYDSNGNLDVLKEHDYGAGAPGSVLQTTNYTYLSTSAYTNLNILNRVTEKTVADSTGTIQYREDTAFDGTTLSSCPTGASQHDDSSYGCSFTTRGNSSSVTTYTNAAAPSGGVTKNSYYDGFGNLVQADLNCCQSKKWAFSATTQYAYPDSETCGLTGGPQTTTTFTYNSYSGQKSGVTDPNNQPTTFSYDTIRRPTITTRPDNAHISTTYSDSQHKYARTTPIQGTALRTSNLDGLGRIVVEPTTDSSNNTYAIVQKTYDSLGRAYTESVPYLSTPQYWRTMQYDALGRMTKSILPDGQQTVYSYSGPNTTVTDPAGKQRKTQFDGLGRSIVVFEPDVTNGNSLTIQTSYSYTVLDKVGTITEGSQTRTLNYDGMGRLTSETNPESGTTSYQYNAFDLITQKTDARGVITTYSYDTMNRPYQIIYNVGSTGVAATPTITYTYGTSTSQNNNGRLLTMTDGVGSETYSYDILGRTTQIQKIINGTTYTTSFAYNPSGEVTSITYPSGRVVQQSFDAIGRLCEIAPQTSVCGDSVSPYASGFTYNTTFLTTGFTFGNNVVASLTYSSDRQQLTNISHTKGSQTLFGQNYFYKTDSTNCPNAPANNNGQLQCIVDMVDTGRNVTYMYDALARLTSAVTNGSTTYPKWGLSFAFDRYGNRTAQNVNAGTAPSNSVTIAVNTNHITGTGYSYDANGNMTSDGQNTLTYDAENRLLTSSGSLGSGTYTYDGNGVRVKKVSGGTSTVSIYFGTRLMAEYQNGASPSSPTDEYINVGNQILAVIASGSTYYFHNDNLSLRVRTNSSGTIQDQRGTYPFGETWYSPTGASLMFTNYERDLESSNDYASARYYANRLGRFVSSDPAASVRKTSPQTLNRYSYVSNDSINRTDPSGMRPAYCQERPYSLLDDDLGDLPTDPDSGSPDSGSIDIGWLGCGLGLDDLPPPGGGGGGCDFTMAPDSGTSKAICDGTTPNLQVFSATPSSGCTVVPSESTCNGFHSQGTVTVTATDKNMGPMQTNCNVTYTAKGEAGLSAGILGMTFDLHFLDQKKNVSHTQHILVVCRKKKQK